MEGKQEEKDLHVQASELWGHIRNKDYGIAKNKAEILWMCLVGCDDCGGTGIITGNNDLPCNCFAGATALFNVAGVGGLVTGAEMKRHFLNGSPELVKQRKRKEVKKWE